MACVGTPPNYAGLLSHHLRTPANCICELPNCNRTLPNCTCKLLKCGYRKPAKIALILANVDALPMFAKVFA